MKNILSGLLEEVEELEEKVKTKGIVPREICDLCKAENKREVVEFSSRAKNVKLFEKWLKENNIISLKKQYVEPYGYYSDLLTILATTKIKGLRSTSKDEKGFIYQYSLKDKKSLFYNKFQKDKSFMNFLLKYDDFIFCPHLNYDNYSICIIKYYLGIQKIFVGCKECKAHFYNTMCDNVIKTRFIYEFNCNLFEILFKKRFIDRNLKIEELKEEYKKRDIGGMIWSSTRYSNSYYLKENNILINLNPNFYPRGDINEEVNELIKYLQPELCVIFGDYSYVTKFINLNINILFYNKNGFFFYDKNKDIEKDIDIIIENITNNLNSEIEYQRGNDHDRTILALNSIGQQLGYISQTEFSKSGMRLDLVWYDREGNIQVACEVETSSTWKKDLISTWEVEPKLAIIVGFAKTDMVAENLMEIALMKYVPHPVFYINKYTDHAFLFDKQKIIKYYTLKKGTENNG